MTPLQIDKLLDVSTCHITQKDSELLAQDALEGDEAARIHGLPLPKGGKVSPFIVYAYPEGFRVWTGFPVRSFAPNDNEYINEAFADARKVGYSEALLTLIRVAAENDCRFLLLDRDGQEYEQFESFDW